MLKQIWLDAEWVSTPGIHQAVSNVEQLFKLVAPGEQLSETERFLEVIRANGDMQEGIAPQRVLMFVNKAEHGWALSTHLREKGFKVYTVTSRLDPEKAGEMIERFQNQEINLLVCTDILGRGIDTKVDWVINVDFPENAQCYLHRVGRTGRAGEPGQVMTFYTIYEADLANAVQEVAESGGSFHSCFSRKRSFRRRLLRAEERGELTRMSAPRIHELKYDERRVDPHFRDPSMMETFLENLKKDEQKHAGYMEETYDRPFSEILNMRDKYDGFRRYGQIVGAQGLEKSMNEAMEAGDSLENSDYQEMTEEQFDELMKHFEQSKDEEEDLIENEENEFRSNVFVNEGAFEDFVEEEADEIREAEDDRDYTVEPDETEEEVDDYQEWKEKTRDRHRRRKQRKHIR